MSSKKLPNPNDSCGRYLKYSHFIECSDTYIKNTIDNIPTSLATYHALNELAEKVVDPLWEHFGSVTLTFGVATVALQKKIKNNIAPALDQHAAAELSNSRRQICKRGGAACDLRVCSVDSLTLAKWIVSYTLFDRLYFYGRDRPVHVSVGPQNSRKCSVMAIRPDGRPIPRTFAVGQFLQLSDL